MKSADPLKSPADLRNEEIQLRYKLLISFLLKHPILRSEGKLWNTWQPSSPESTDPHLDIFQIGQIQMGSGVEKKMSKTPF